MSLLIFQNRQEAGKLLAEKLNDFKGRDDILVLGIPRGGVVTAYEVAVVLKVPLDVIVTRKIGAPGNPELAVGAVNLAGRAVYNKHLVNELGVGDDYLKRETERQKREARRRGLNFRGGRKKLNLKGKTAIIVDDGIATGYTALTAVNAAKSLGAKKVILAAPVIAADTLLPLRETADEVVYLEAPADFYAVGQYYQDFPQVEDEEAIKLLKLTN